VFEKLKKKIKQFVASCLVEMKEGKTTLGGDGLWHIHCGHLEAKDSNPNI
jgi:hypothetical protein